MLSGRCQDEVSNQIEAERMLRVLITDDYPAVRKNLKQILEMEQGFGIIDEAADGMEMLEKMKSNRYDLILLDISMPGKSGLELIKEILSVNNETKILMVSIYSESQYALRAKKLGASGYLLKVTAPDHLVDAIRTIISGMPYYPGLNKDMYEH